ncbi:DEAD/DEAH box helicase [Actinokineospora terrae]|uniref:SNF2 family N-terminal domain-containing protein n=1 Tax=Actinokineospora terrae TaxID=155974 RepID=A0A1H9NWN2_9PSEU|nr:DEAD/DEAH box helicase [Actinokineospora terrae]SER40207.1 SNF2 family N-terminal domain-containing protein [Actinokineospora terrae]
MRPLVSVRVEDTVLVARLLDEVDERHWAEVVEWFGGLGFDTADEVVRVQAWDSPRFAGCLVTAPADRFQWRLSAGAEAVLARQRAVAAEFREVLAVAPARDPDWPDTVPEPAEFGFRRVLTPAQRGDVIRLMAMRHGGNFGVPGSGKTTVAYCVWAAERAVDAIDGLLVLAPLSAFEAWRDEPAACFTEAAAPLVHLMPEPIPAGADVVVLGYSRLTQPHVLAEVDGWASARRVMVVFDESHRVKAGPAGTWGRAAVRLATRSERRYVLSGTPMPNTAADLAAQFDLCWPGYGHDLASGSLQGVRNRLYVRTTKKQLDLPRLHTTIERVPLEPDHRRVYDALAGSATDTLADPALVADVEALGSVLLRLIAAATNPAAVLDVGTPLRLPTLVDRSLPLEDLVRNTAATVRPAKLIRAAQIVDANAAAGRKTLVWSVFVANIAAMADLLAAHHPAVVTGAVGIADPRLPTDRARELERFRHDDRCTVLIATPQTLGEGVSLHTACVDQVHLDRTFNAGLYLQSLDRTHRLGMDADSKPTVTVLLAENTVDQLVHDSLAAKIRDMSNALNDPTLARMHLPDTDATLTPQDLLLDGNTSAQDLATLLRRVRGH